MKKTLCYILLIALILSFCACTDSKKDSEQSTNDTNIQNQTPDSSQNQNPLTPDKENSSPESSDDGEYKTDFGPGIVLPDLSLD